jgi:hypothetical protein
VLPGAVPSAAFHAADAHGRPVAQVKLRRAQVLDYFRALPCRIGMEVCATAHYWRASSWHWLT